MATTNTWDEVVTKITGVANNGAFSNTFIPTTSSQSASGGAGYYSSVTTICNAVSLSGNSGTAQVLSGYTFYNTALTKQTGTMANRGVLNWTPAGSTAYSVPAGYYSGGTLNSSGAYNAGYNSGVNTLGQKLTYSLYNPINEKTGSGTFTASTAGYYIGIAYGTGTNKASGKSGTITTTGSSKSYIRLWGGNGDVSTSQVNCVGAIAVMLAYLASGQSMSLSFTTYYNTTGLLFVAKLG